jgi:hypothetical protein
MVEALACFGTSGSSAPCGIGPVVQFSKNSDLNMILQRLHDPSGKVHIAIFAREPKEVVVPMVAQPQRIRVANCITG